MSAVQHETRNFDMVAGWNNAGGLDGERLAIWTLASCEAPRDRLFCQASERAGSGGRDGGSAAPGGSMCTSGRPNPRLTLVVTLAP